ncbi:hypothetical protein L1D33_14495 [Vibrio chagasii]|uniref:hypothetical protein n=1 Tax=Vibrio chagasii TaxID=170679 RepID=UPI001EFE19EE|nr:hypothetical protein [Vibrio chagasii]MCG9674754.1 hypothetical protein [Vibrio chagasii]
MSETDASVHRKGLEASFKILERWEANNVQILSILGISNSIDQILSSGQLSTEQITRISYILNIHAALRTLFNNDKNVYGFMIMENKSIFFSGERPLSLIESGDLKAIERVANHLISLSQGN